MSEQESDTARLVRVEERLATLADKIEKFLEQTQVDVESRLRDLEKRVWMLFSGVALLAFVGEPLVAWAVHRMMK